MSDVVQLMRAANPVRDSVAALPDDEFDALLLLTQVRSGNVDVEQFETPVEPERKRHRGWLVAAAAFIAVLIVGFATLFWPTPRGGQPLVDEPTTTVTSTTTPSSTTVTSTTTPSSTTAAPSPLSLADTWQRVGADVMTPVLGLFDMTETALGLVAVGDVGPGNGVILISSDGVTWTRLAEDDPALNLGTVAIFSVTDRGPGLVAVGMGCEDDAEPCMPYPTVWTSSDGIAWDRSPANPDVFGESGALLDVVRTEHGLVAAGGFYTTRDDVELNQPSVWLSPDGIQWERVWQGEAYDFTTASGITGFMALATSADGRVVGVGTAVNDQGEFVGAIWTSTDGRTWERIDRNSEAFASGTDSDVSIGDVASGPGGFVAVGTDGGTDVAIWHSPDGLSWTRANTDNQPFEYIGALSAVDALGTGWVIAGPPGFSPVTGGTVTLWTSPDGLTWDRVHSIDPGYAMSVVATDSGITIAGGTWGDDDDGAAVWAGPSFDPAAPPPDPGPTEPPDQ